MSGKQSQNRVATVVFPLKTRARFTPQRAVPEAGNGLIKPVRGSGARTMFSSCSEVVSWKLFHRLFHFLGCFVKKQNRFRSWRYRHEWNCVGKLEWVCFRFAHNDYCVRTYTTHVGPLPPKILQCLLRWSQSRYRIKHGGQIVLFIRRKLVVGAAVFGRGSSPF